MHFRLFKGRLLLLFSTSLRALCILPRRKFGGTAGVMVVMACAYNPRYMGKRLSRESVLKTPDILGATTMATGGDALLRTFFTCAHREAYGLLNTWH